ncbi:MAG: hypothetical protein ABI333_15865, partial [bacterium]
MSKNKRMKRIACLVALPLLVAFGWGGCKNELGGYAKDKAKKSLAQLEGAQAKLKKTEGSLAALVNDDKAYMKQHKVVQM